MDQSYQVVYQGRLRRGQTRAAVAGRLSEALGQDRAAMDKLLDDSEKVLLRTASENQAQRLAEIFTQAGAEIRLERPNDTSDEPEPEKAPARPVKAKPSVPPSLGQRLWLLRAAGVLLVLAAVAGLGFTLLVAALLTLMFSYSWALGLVPWPAVVLPVYVTLVLVLLLIIAGLVKPFVRLGSRRPSSIRLERANERELFDFVGHVCEVLHVPYPRAILVDMSASVTAGTQPGSDLTIGVPLLASATTAELGGLVARALTLHIGGASGRLGRFVTSAVYRLHDAVHGRDMFDEALQRGLQSRNPLVVRAAREASTLLRLSRRVLGYLLKEAIGTSAAAMQSIEWHRDRHQAQIVGSEAFAKSLRLMRLVQFSVTRLDTATRELWQKGRPLPAELPTLLTTRVDALTRQETLSKVLALAEREQEKVPHFHLADAKRIERLRKHPIAPGLTCAAPARALVRGFAVLSRRLTLQYYRNRLRLTVTPPRLQLRAGGEQTALDAITGNAYLDVMFVAPQRFVDRSKALSELVATARTLAEGIPAASESARKSIARYREVEHLLLESLFEELVLRSARSTRRTRARLEEVQTRCRALEGSLDRAYGELMPHSELISRRLANGVALLEQPATASRLPGATALAAQAASLSEALDKIQQQLGNLRDMGIHTALLEMLLTNYGSDAGGALKDRIAEQEADSSTLLTTLRVALKRVNNPLKADTYLFEQARVNLVPTGARYTVLDEAGTVREGLLGMKGRIIARLAVLTRAAESAWLGQSRVTGTG